MLGYRRSLGSFLLARSGEEPALVESDFAGRLPSKFDELYFNARFTAAIRPGTSEPSERAARSLAAQSAVRACAAEVARKCSPADPEGTELDVNRALLADPELSSQGIAWSRCELEVPAEDVQRARDRELAQHDSEVLALRHRTTMEQASLLRTEVFQDGGLARLWWLARFPDQVERIPQIGVALDEVVDSTTASTQEADDGVGQVIGLCMELLQGLNADERAHLGHRVVEELHRIFQACERPGLSEKLEGIAGTS
ncbi:hypothetical protein HDA32_001118 [Spinactinospora alkalitolerans]|uniref:Uncharacterized protein n=1 Tax=Spinactinospora alkalitolerans TaxID=687207 RepID=A0A852TPV9_9ACTN|nr:hypothetical protein [Spinactinospora alkalitolerans]NYE45998.1 hypothetical protein [Spinactinospora alkalitolerans]